MSVTWATGLVLRGLVVVSSFLPPEVLAQSFIPCVERYPTRVPFLGGGIAEGGLAFESSTGHCFWFGGIDALGRTRTSVYEWTGHSWLERVTPNGPSARRHFALTSLHPKQGVLLHGGMDDKGATKNETWLWTGTAWRFLTASGPTALWMHALTYDSGRDRVLLFGGDVAGKLDFPIYELWEFDGTSWLRRLAHFAPIRRFGHVMAYDPVRQRTLVFGGMTNQGVVIGDPWEWDGFRWLPSTPIVQPPPRAFARCTYDAVRGKIVLSGGTPSLSGPALNDLWEWDSVLNSWTALIPLGRGPDARESHGLAFDPVRGRTLLVGGQARNGNGVLVFADTWELFGANPSASATSYGMGCAGANGIPQLLAFGVPRVGDPTFALFATGARASSPCALFFSLSPAARPLLGKCRLLVEEPLVALPAGTNQSGSALLPFPVPPGNELYGVEFFAQGFFADPAGGIGAFASASGGLALLLGN